MAGKYSGYTEPNGRIVRLSTLLFSCKTFDVILDNQFRLSRHRRTIRASSLLNPRTFLTGRIAFRCNVSCFRVTLSFAVAIHSAFTCLPRGFVFPSITHCPPPLVPCALFLYSGRMASDLSHPSIHSGFDPCSATGSALHRRQKSVVIWP